MIFKYPDSDKMTSQQIADFCQRHHNTIFPNDSAWSFICQYVVAPPTIPGYNGFTDHHATLLVLTAYFLIAAPVSWFVTGRFFRLMGWKDVSFMTIVRNVFGFNDY